MNKEKKNGLVALIYAGLIILCLCIVCLVSELHNPGRHGGESVTETETGERTRPSESEAEPDQEETEPGTEPSLSAGEEAGSDGESWENIPPFCAEAETDMMEETEPEPYVPPSIVVASDVHYYPAEMTDFGEAFETMVSRDDGKMVPYISQLMDTFSDEMVEMAPDAVILSGDLTLNGERGAHEALAGKLHALKERGVRVLVIPGNHDINNRNAAFYFGEDRTAAPGIDAGEFLEIYHEFGYDQAVSRDETSLSYIFPLDEKNWLMMLDSAQYEPVNLVGGRIRNSTVTWMREQLEAAKELGMNVIPIAHHNLLEESRLYPDDCTLENSAEVVALLEEYRIPVYISGHLHLQRTKKYKPEPGEPEDVYHISEIVADSFAIPPCQYGILKWNDDGSLNYHTQEVDVEGWAAENGETDENLLHFKEYGTNFLVGVISSQIYKKMSSLPREHMQKMADIYGELNRAYCAGEPIDVKQVRSEEGFRLWERNLPDSKMFEEMDDILRDTTKDHNSWNYPAP